MSKRTVDGVVLLDKPPGITSNDLLQRVKRLFNAQKAGHTGALDPIATGILPICFGQATKLSQFLLNANKRYLVQATLGQTTTTADCEGDVISTASIDNISRDKIIALLPHFIGHLKQVPPMFSALKKAGVPLYKLARAGKTVERQARDIEIFSLTFIDYQNGILSCDVSCSKGTYIRTLIEDIGNELGCGAFVSALRRVGFAHYDISQTHDLNALTTLNNPNNNSLDKALLKSEDMVPDFNRIDLDNEQTRCIRQGQAISFIINKSNNNPVTLFSDNHFIGIGTLTDGMLMPKRLLIT